MMYVLGIKTPGLFFMSFVQRPSLSHGTALIVFVPRIFLYRNPLKLISEPVFKSLNFILPLKNCSVEIIP